MKFSTDCFKEQHWKKDSCEFDQVIKENLWEFHEACKYVHQILLIVNKGKVDNQGRCWMVWKANFAGKLFDWFRLRVASKVFQ